MPLLLGREGDFLGGWYGIDGSLDREARLPKSAGSDLTSSLSTIHPPSFTPQRLDFCNGEGIPKLN